MATQECIRLREAMNQGKEHLVSTWRVSGLHVEDEDIPTDADIHMTFVIKTPNKPYSVGVNFTEKGASSSSMGIVAEFSTLEEMEERMPNLFKLVGTLYAFP